jgi:hypothetical protein
MIRRASARRAALQDDLCIGRGFGIEIGEGSVGKDKTEPKAAHHDLLDRLAAEFLKPNDAFYLRKYHAHDRIADGIALQALYIEDWAIIILITEKERNWRDEIPVFFRFFIDDPIYRFGGPK